MLSPFSFSRNDIDGQTSSYTMMWGSMYFKWSVLHSTLEHFDQVKYVLFLDKELLILAIFTVFSLLMGNLYLPTVNMDKPPQRDKIL